MKQFVYDKRAYFRDVTFISWFCIILMAVAVYYLIMGVLPPIMALVFIVSFYTVWNTYISHSNPEQVLMDEQEICFISFHREDRYAFSEIRQFRVREFPNAGKMYVRINQGGLRRGRYWIQTHRFSDGKELFQKILAKEEELHPDSLKSQARRSSKQYHRISSRGTRKKKS